MVNGTYRTADIGLIEQLLRSAKCSEKLAVSLLTVITIAYLNGVQTMAKKTSKKNRGNGTTSTAETPAQAFCRLAQGRTNKAVKAISLLAQLTGSAYESTETQKRAIIVALQASVEQVKLTFDGKAKASDSFRLPS